MSPRRTRQTPIEPHSARDEDLERDAVADLLAEFGGVANVRIKLQRQSETPPRVWKYVDTTELTPDLIADVKARYGGGSYRALLYDEKGYVRGRILSFHVEGRPRAIDDESDSEVRPRGDDRLARLEAKIEQLGERSSDDTTEKVERVVTIIGSIVTALTPIVAPLLKGGGNTDAVKLLELIQNAEERGERRGERYGTLAAGGAEDSVAAIAAKHIPAALSLLQQTMNRREEVRAPAAIEGAPVTTPSPPAVDRPAPPAGYEWLVSLRPAHLELARQAMADTDPEVIADFALSQCDAELLLEIQRAAGRVDFRDVLRGELSGIAARHSEWLDDFIARLVEVSRPEEELTVAAAPAPASRRKRA